MSIDVSATNNEFDLRDEVLFIEYDGVIKNSRPFMLHKIVNELYDVYKDYLEIEPYKGLSKNACTTISLMMIEPNMFSALAKTNFDWQSGYFDLYDYYPEMFSESEELIMVDALRRTIPQKFCKRIYFYSRHFDERVQKDIAKLFGVNGKIRYAYGDLNEVINNIDEKITGFFLTEHTQLYEMAMYKDIDYTDIYIADYRFNKYREEDGSLVPFYDVEEIFGDSIVKLNEFSPMVLEDQHLEDFTVE